MEERVGEQWGSMWGNNWTRQEYFSKIIIVVGIFLSKFSIFYQLCSYLDTIKDLSLKNFKKKNFWYCIKENFLSVGEHVGEYVGEVELKRSYNIGRLVGLRPPTRSARQPPSF